MFAIFENLNPVDKDVPHARGELVRLLVGRMVLNLRRIEYDQVGEVTRSK
jgi:hypothetical protein